MFRVLAIAFCALPLCAFSAPIGDASKGQAIAGQVCAACHGSDGNSPIAVNPNLAGQHPEYLFKQLRNFKSGARANPIMMGIAASLSEDDMRNLAAYYAAQPPSQLAAQNADLIAQGRKLFRGGDAAKGVPACSGCHSPNGAGIPIQYPRIAGQHAEYTAGQLRAFREGQRANDENQMMRGVASRLTDREIAALAEYLTGLH
jgi:cytochrome c553